MDERSQFTFYRSFWDAVKALPKKDRLPVLEAIIQYALDGEVSQDLSPQHTAFFLLVKPNLDSSRRKAANGKQGGSKPKANASKPKQTESKSDDVESKRENKKENKKEKENYKKEEKERNFSASFDVFWNAYPKKVGKEAARKSWDKTKGIPLDTILTALEAHKRSCQWQRDNGQYIPNPATWLNQGRWQDELPVNTAIPKGASGLGDAELEAIQRLMADEVIL